VDAAAGVRRVALVAVSVIMAIYVLVWTPFAFLMILIWQWPKNWIGWWVIVGNPFLLAFLAGLVQRQRMRKNEHG
jgi:hypothetical protein